MTTITFFLIFVLNSSRVPIIHVFRAIFIYSTTNRKQTKPISRGKYSFRGSRDQGLNARRTRFVVRNALIFSHIQRTIHLFKHIFFRLYLQHTHENTQFEKNSIRFCPNKFKNHNKTTHNESLVIKIIHLMSYYETCS